MLLTSKLNLARLAVGEGHSPAATVADLRALAQQADSLGKKYISVVSTTLMAQALIENKDYAHAKQELQRNLSKSRKAGVASAERKDSLPVGQGAAAWGHDIRSDAAVPRGVALAGRHPKGAGRGTHHRALRPEVRVRGSYASSRSQADPESLKFFAADNTEKEGRDPKISPFVLATRVGLVAFLANGPSQRYGLGAARGVVRDVEGCSACA